MDYESVDVRGNVSAEQFVAEYVVPARTLVITDGLRGWEGLSCWSFPALTARYGELVVPIHDGNFDATASCRLREYITSFSSLPQDPEGCVPYLKGTAGHGSDLLSQAIFRELQERGARPYFLPASGYATPELGPQEEWDPLGGPELPFAFGALVSPRGGRSRLHADGQHTEALVFQFVGRKRAYLFPPSEERALREWAATGPPPPRLDEVRRFGEARGYLADLEPGQVLLIPRLWFHEVECLTPIIGLSFNFALAQTEPARKEWARRGGAEHERFFY